MMSARHLPAELLDYIVDLLSDSRATLKICSLVSKSWIPRTRKHLFAYIQFFTANQLRSWKSTFPDPLTSPARYAKTLFLKVPQSVTTADAEECQWMMGFSRVSHFAVNIHRRRADNPETFLLPFHGFSPLVKSLRLSFGSTPFPPVFDFICSFPLLEDLSVIACTDKGRDPEEHQIFVQPSNPPPFTGLLKLRGEAGIDPVASRLLEFSSDLRFRALNLAWEHEKDISLTTALVERCYSTLESLTISCGPFGKLSPGPTDLSKATKLKDVMFVWDRNPQWITATLQTITSDHQDIRQVSIDFPSIFYGFDPGEVDPDDFGRSIGDTTFAKWLELDRLLASLWRTHSVKTRIFYYLSTSTVDRWCATSCIHALFPEVTRRRAILLVGEETFD